MSHCSGSVALLRLTLATVVTVGSADFAHFKISEYEATAVAVGCGCFWFLFSPGDE